MMMVVGKKQVGESWHPKVINQTQFKLRQLNPIRATATPTTRKLVAVADNTQHLVAQGKCPLLFSRYLILFSIVYSPEVTGTS